jgi:twitching motility protein PilJ
MSTTSGALGRERGGSANTVLFVVLGLLFLFAIVDFGYLYFKNRQDNQARSYTTQIQVLSQALAKYASEAAGGNELAFKELESTGTNIDTYVRSLISGDKRGMPGYANEPTVKTELEALTKAWAQLQAGAKKILDSKDTVLNASTSAKDFGDKLSALNSRMSEVVNILTDRNASASQVYIASRQMQLVDRFGLLRASDLAAKQPIPDVIEAAAQATLAALHGIKLGDGALSSWQGCGPGECSRLAA